MYPKWEYIGQQENGAGDQVFSTDAKYWTQEGEDVFNKLSMTRERMKSYE